MMRTRLASLLGGASLAVGCLTRAHRTTVPAAPVQPPDPHHARAQPLADGQRLSDVALQSGGDGFRAVRGPRSGKQLMRDKDVKVVWNLMASNPTVKKIGIGHGRLRERHARNPEDPARPGRRSSG